MILSKVYKSGWSLITFFAQTRAPFPKISLDIASKTLPIVLAANMCIGVHQLKDSLKSFIKKNKNRVKCSIEETHHLKKLDKPSGTAIEIENLI